MQKCNSTENCPTKEDAAAQIAILNKMAFQSMREASEYGALIQFIKSTFEAHDNEGLLKAFFSCVESYGLSCSIQIREAHLGENLSATFISDHELATPTEDSILGQLIDRGRIVDFPERGIKRTIFNDKHVSFLVKNMPDDPDDYGRKKDVLAVLLEGFEARLVSLKKQESLRSILQELIETVNELSMLFNVNSDEMVKVMESLMIDMNRAFHNLALTEEQEDHFTKLVDNSIGQLVIIHNEGRDIEDKFSAIVQMAHQTLRQ